MACSNKAIAAVSSLTAWRKSATSSLRRSRSSFISVSVWLMAALRVSMSIFSWPARSFERLIFFSALPMALPRSSMSFVFLSAAFSQRSRCAMSSCSSWRRTSIIWSMAAITLSKCPPLRSRTAICAKPMLWYLRAKLPNLTECERSSALAPLRREVAETWTKVVTDLWKTSRESSFVRMWMASPTPVSSMVRRCVRSLHSSALCLQPALTSSNNFSSASSLTLVSSRSALLSAKALVFVASSISWDSRVA
mmetsp:Transcript_121383/g.339908  ORF Transcript_121383/g.339908 Transcript_121383/m.339908 type:complete len:251 (-) Transcript_121383:111-863(-)